MDAQKKAMIAAMEKALGVVTTACKTVGISRQTHYNWLQDPDYAAAIEDVSEVAVDFAESHLHKLIKEGNPAATIFFLKTKGKNRGYVERQEIAVAEKKPLSWLDEK
jgi:transcriptional regulator of acetoin/glycerol metabolism